MLSARWRGIVPKSVALVKECACLPGAATVHPTGLENSARVFEIVPSQDVWMTVFAIVRRASATAPRPLQRKAFARLRETATRTDAGTVVLARKPDIAVVHLLLPDEAPRCVNKKTPSQVA